MRLRDRLALLPDDRALISSPHGVLTRDAVIGFLPKAAELKGIKVALSISDAGQALQILSALDGVADSILLISPSLETSLKVNLALKAQCHAILCDAPAEFDDIEASPAVFSTLDALVRAHDREHNSASCDTRWIMTTSGTTGAPKLVSHTLISLSRTSNANFERGQSQRWGMLYDYTRFAGMQVFLQSVLSGALLIAPNSDASFDEKLKRLVKEGCTHLSATPTLWRKIVMTPGSQQLNLVQATLGGEIADSRILKGVASHYPSARVVHIFASTEAGVGFSVSDGREGFPESYLNNPPKDVDIRVDDGRLYLRNAHVMPNYLGEDTSFSDENGWVETGDAVSVRQGRVYFLGRASGIINVGGDKVHPEEVEHVLLTHPQIAAARVYAKNNPITGALVAADIVLVDSNTNADTICDEVKAYAVKNLERHKVPVMLKVVSEFKTNSAGKLIRKKS